MTYDEWYEQFVPMVYMDGDVEMIHDMLDEAVKVLPTENLWTELDTGEIVPGIRIVNRFRYIATAKPWEDKELIVFSDEAE